MVGTRVGLAEVEEEEAAAPAAAEAPATSREWAADDDLKWDVENTGISPYDGG